MEDLPQNITSKEDFEVVERRHTSSVSDIAEQKRKRYSKSREIFSIDEGSDRKSRKRLLVQRSLSLPDVVPSTSPVFDEAPISPDILREHKIIQATKLKIEGPVCKPRPKSVSFFDEYRDNVSAHGKVRRAKLREKKSSSGYWTGGSDESNISLDVVSNVDKSHNKKQDVDTISVEKVQHVTSNPGVTTNPVTSNGIPTISLFTFNSSGSVYVNEEVIKQFTNYDTGLAQASRTPQSSESVSPLSQFCYDRLREEQNESVTENTLNQPSRFDIQREEGKLKKELYQGEFERQMLLNKVTDEKIFSFSEGTTPSPHDIVNDRSKTRNDGNLQSLPQPKSLDVCGKDKRLYDSSLKDALEKYCNCYNKDLCRDKQCNEIQAAIEEIRICIDYQSQPTSTKSLQILLALQIHSLECKQAICPVPWCNVLNTYSGNESSIRNAIAVLSDNESTFTGCKQLKDCVKICARYNYGYKEGIDWFSLMPLNTRKNVIIAESLGNLNKQDTKWVIKKTNLNDYNQQLSVYRRLRQFASPYIVQHYWACECDSTDLLICTKYISGIPLSEILNKSRYDEKEVCRWMCHIITGVLHLHKYDIIYLKWTSKNIVIDNMKDCLKITDLSCSVLSTHRQSEYHEIKQLLPPTILPPEIDNVCAEINEKSDSWGCACLLYELCMTYPVFHHLCHQRKDQIWKQINSMPMPNLPKIWQIYQPILDTLWRIPIDDRATIETALANLHDIYVS